MIRTIRIEIDEIILERFDDSIDNDTIATAIKEEVRSLISGPDVMRDLARLGYSRDADFASENQLGSSRSASIHIADVDGGSFNLLSNSDSGSNGDKSRENAAMIGNQIGRSVFKGFRTFKSERKNK